MSDLDCLSRAELLELIQQLLELITELTGREPGQLTSIRKLPVSD